MRARIELALAVVAAVGCVLSWWAAGSTVTVSPVLAGQPPTTSVDYSPQMVVLSVLLATAAGVFAVLGITHRRRASK
jgi:hypothetical protein